MKKKYLKILLISIFIICSVILYLGSSSEAFQSYNLPKKVWSYWNEEKFPPLIEKIIRNNKKTLVGWDFTTLHDKNIHDYIPKEDFPQKYDTLAPAHKSDWIRLYLLKKYGGLWLDASLIINDGGAIDTLYRESCEKKSQYTGFYKHTDKKGDTGKIPKWIENWFILAPLDSPIINSWFIEFTRAIDIGFDNYKIKMDEEKIDISWGSGATYHTAYFALQKVVQENPNESMIIKDSLESMYKINYECKWNADCTLQGIIDDDGRIPYIKIMSSDRNSKVDILPYLDKKYNS